MKIYGIKIPIPKQRNLGRTPGAIRGLFGGALFYISLVTSILNALVSYDISIHPRYTWLPFVGYVFILFMILLSGMLFEYVFMALSSNDWANHQSVVAANPVYNNTQEIKQMLLDIKVELNKKVDK